MTQPEPDADTTHVRPATSRRRLTGGIIAALVLAVLGGAAGYVVGNGITPKYTSVVLLNSGRLDVQSQAVPGFAEGARNLASLYSRITVSDAVLDRVEKRTGTPRGQLLSDVDATPVPGDAVFRVAVTRGTPGEARRLALVVTEETMKYIRGLTATDGRSSELLRRYRTLLAEAEELAGRGDRERSRLRRLEITGGSKRLRSLRVEEAATRLRAETVAALFTTDQTETKGGASVTLLSSASAPTSDASSNAERYALLGALAGLLLGAGIVLLTGLRSTPGRR